MAPGTENLIDIWNANNGFEWAKIRVLEVKYYGIKCWAKMWAQIISILFQLFLRYLN